MHVEHGGCGFLDLHPIYFLNLRMLFDSDAYWVMEITFVMVIFISSQI